MLGSILLIAGTSIGAAMLALPITTGLAGFFPAVLLFFLYWIYMTESAFFLLETTLWIKKETNIISMAHETIGKWGELLAWATYLFLLSCLTTAYVAGGGHLFILLIKHYLGIELSEKLTIFILLFLFGFALYQGTKIIDFLNRIMMVGLFLTFAALCFYVIPDVNLEYLAYNDLPKLPLAFSITATSFGYQFIVPTLSIYLGRNVSQLVRVILIGSLIPLGVYTLWIFITLGTIPLPLIEEGYREGANGAIILSNLLNNIHIRNAAKIFSFLAIVTSFFGVTLCLSDFLSDGLKIKKTATGRVLLACLTIVPPYLFTLYNPRAFLVALEYAGLIGVIILLGLLPALMVYYGRYKRGLTGPYEAPGGKAAVVGSIILSCLLMATIIYTKVIG